MNTQMRNFTAKEFMKKLADDDFETAVPLILTGMVKPAEDDQHLIFALGFNCANWFALPVEMIENIQWLGSVPCKDHAHPFVNITIKEPEDERTKVFANLAKSMQTTRVRSEPMGIPNQAMAQMLRNRGLRRMESANQSGPEVWFPCWNQCMKDFMAAGSDMTHEQFVFWMSIGQQICDWDCP
jgi:hypothetical protein